MSRLFIAGDIAYRGRVAQNIDNGKGILISEGLLSAINSAEYSVINLESPVGDPSLFIKKAGPSLCCPPEMLSSIKSAGFKGVTLANNHFYDCGQKGVKKTIDACIQYCVDYYGGGLTICDAKEKKRIHIQNQCVEIINVCENEFSSASDNHGGANGLNLVSVYRDIVDSVKKGNKVLVIIHGGHEYYQLPSPRMQELYRFFIDVGASAVINHHQHCYSGYEVYNGCPIFYGLGNFYFDSTSKKRKCLWNKGYAVSIDIFDPISFSIHPYIQCDEEPIVRDLLPDEIREFEDTINDLNRIIVDQQRLADSWKCFADNKRIQRVFSPFYNGITVKFYNKRWAPALIPFKQRLSQLNYIQCESHRDILLYKLKSELRIER